MVYVGSIPTPGYMAKQSAKAQLDDMEIRLKALGDLVHKLKRERTYLIAWVHEHGGDIDEILNRA
jgi:hypothetical protein